MFNGQAADAANVTHGRTRTTEARAELLHSRAVSRDDRSLDWQQGEFFSTRGPLPAGFQYMPEFVSPADEQRLIAIFATLPLQAATYRTFTAKRRIASFGAGYDFAVQAPTPAPPIPEFLRDVCARSAEWAHVAAVELAQCTIAEYSPGTQLGWHRDAPSFGLVIGISLAAPCRMRFRPYPHVTHARAPAHGITLEPRSIYILQDHARWRWQHAIAPTKSLRYSITFRTMPAAVPASGGSP